MEEAELDFRPLEESEEYMERDDSESEQTKDADKDIRHGTERSEGDKLGTRFFFNLQLEHFLLLG